MIAEVYLSGLLVMVTEQSSQYMGRFLIMLNTGSPRTTMVPRSIS